jgi:hypothetical protein
MTHKYFLNRIDAVQRLQQVKQFAQENPHLGGELYDLLV